jgi:hypothetical protein
LQASIVIRGFETTSMSPLPPRPFPAAKPVLCLIAARWWAPLSPLAFFETARVITQDNMMDGKEGTTKYAKGAKTETKHLYKVES